jgi:hypothetical protein
MNQSELERAITRSMCDVMALHREQHYAHCRRIRRGWVRAALYLVAALIVLGAAYEALQVAV